MDAKEHRRVVVYNTASRKKEVLIPLEEGHIGMYVCGPTVYGSPHIGHARSVVVFDLLHRLLRKLGYRVTMVRNITDVGHMEGDADEGEDKILKKARSIAVHPAQIAHTYTIEFWRMCEKLNALTPSIEPLATAHIQEQIALVEAILKKGYAYEVNGTVYFDVIKYDRDFGYGVLSGRNIEDLLPYTRELRGKGEKRNPHDFALWKRAWETHIMRWRSPWGEGFPGWHLECSAMSIKYLGEEFDIHGGGIDLIFPHHECEMAQNKAATGKSGPRYWIHNNLITIEGKKMSKQLGNYIEPLPLFEKKEITPAELRFYLISAHYRSPLNWTIKGVRDSQKAFRRLMEAWRGISSNNVKEGEGVPINPSEIKEKVVELLCDDLNVPGVMAYLFELVPVLNSIASGELPIESTILAELRNVLQEIFVDLLGIIPEESDMREGDELITNLINLLVNVRHELRARREYELADRIREALRHLGIDVRDRTDGTIWILSKTGS